MSIESLKQQARKHEQNEDWKKALEQYKKALAELAHDEQVDIGLHNRVGDLYVRVGQLDQSVEHYEKAVELYREAYLPNNAIAVCKKIIRNVPERHKAYLVIGQIRAEQGFLPDARTNFLTYAERMQKAGDLDESFRALIEFCDLAPDDVGVRITVAEQMAASGRKDEAVEQLQIAHRHYTVLGETSQAEGLEAKILAIDPEASLDAMPAMGGFGGSSLGDDGEIVPQFGEISVGGDAFGESNDDEISFATHSAIEDTSREAEVDGDDVEIGADGFVLDDDAFGAGSDDEEVVELPMMDLEDDGDEDDAPLPTIDFGDQPEEAEAEPLPTIDFDDAEAGEDEALELPMMAMEDDTSEVEAPTSDLGLAASMEEAAEDAADETEDAPPQPSTREPAGGGDQGYVDFGAMILGTGKEKTTRFKVAYEEPSGDEEADFAKMLSQFKEKVTENLDSSDVRAHYDLGTAYKEMGLLDEAISSFQAALRASADHLPTYEVMGQTFIEMGKPEAAVRSLERAVESANTVEDELVGIYYYLGRAYEALDNKTSAVEFYDRVFALDINFADVTERLRELR
jgi:tetratricopeptide (TPR) repeat protein